MKGVVYIIRLVIILAIFGLPLLRCFMGLLVVGLGVDADAALTLGIFLTVALVAGMGIKTFFIDK